MAIEPQNNLNWQLASFFLERLAANRPADDGAQVPTRRLQRWLGKPFDDTQRLQQRLDSDHASLQDLHQLLSASPAQIMASLPQKPFWAKELIVALSEPAPQIRFDLDAFLSNMIRDHPIAGFLNLLKPLMRRGINLLEQRLDALVGAADAPFEVDTAVRFWFDSLPSKLSEITSRSMVLELNVARLRKTLTGETPEQRFQYFLDTLDQEQVRHDLLQEYIVIGRMASTAIHFWANNGVEFFTRLRQDWPQLKQTFFADADPGLLTHLKANMGDTHRQGRTVVELRFGAQARLIYKPRALAVELHFQDLLIWANHKGFQPAFKTLQVLDREEYGWVEFVPWVPCQEEAQIARFFQRQGGYLALLYMLDATDFHSENLIACGEHPMLIDLESLFQPRLDEATSEEDKTQADYALVCSVARIGLLPEISMHNIHESFARGGLIDLEGQLTPKPVIRANDEGADTMMLARKYVPMSGNRNMPRLADQKLNASNYVFEIEAGFRDAYNLIAAHKHELLSAAGPLAPFEMCETRIILRGTTYYVKILLESYHPDFMRDGLERDRYLDRLWGGVQTRPAIAAAIPYEKQDLLAGDVPLFTTRPNVRDVWSSGGARLPNMLHATPYQRVHQKIEHMGPPDLQLQQWIVRCSLMSFIASDRHQYQDRIAVTLPDQPASRASLLNGAEKAAARLTELAFEGTEKASWLGLDMVAGSHWKLSVLNCDFYYGLSGIALFLGYLGSHSGQPQPTQLARKCLVSVEENAQKDGLWRLPEGFGMVGLGGLVYTYTHLACLWQDASLIEKALELARLSEAMLQKNPAHDIIHGMAGAILPLLGLFRVTAKADILALAVKLGDNLLAAARPIGNGIAWDNGQPGTPLPGFSHGTAGIAYALMELAAVSGATRFDDAARQAIAYDRSLYSKAQGNWDDCAVEGSHDADGNARQYRVAWCHGAPGIGLTRIKLLDHFQDPLLHAELQQAIHTTEQHGLGRDHCLCHGDLGNLELLLSASRTLQDAALANRAYRHAAGVLESIETHGWRCGVPQTRETPGLMVGLAGIGYGLLRFAFPDTVPNLLVLEAPVTGLSGQSH
jgi:type 2 lantibiotic biosynthesis protein LanM